MKKQRIEYFDAAKGIAIIAVIVGHMGLIARGMTLTERFIFSFHMPIFFLISGYFLSSRMTLWEFAKKRFKQLIFPYIFTWGIMCAWLPVIYIYASQHRILDNALNLMNCKKDIYQIDLDKIKQNIKKVDASEDEMIIYVDTLVNDYGSSVDECLKYVKQELNYNKSELLGTDDMSNIYLLKR